MLTLYISKQKGGKTPKSAQKRSKGTLTKKKGEVLEPARGISYLFEILEYDR